jgi:hypothetical protein
MESRVYILRTENGTWLGQVVLTEDGMFASVTDYGNLSYSWRGFGKDFREFILNLNEGYFGDKMVTGLAYIAYSTKIKKACARFAEKILPALQQAIREELERENQCTKEL